jgi:DNA transformation protein and related proteins
MPDLSEFARYAHEQLADLGEVTAARFFGGVGFKLGHVQFAMCMRDTLYFVVDAATRERYLAAGSAPFQYRTAKGARLVHRYYEVPADVIEDRDALLRWAQDAVAAATSQLRAPSGRTSKQTSKGKKRR